MKKPQKISVNISKSITAIKTLTPFEQKVLKVVASVPFGRTQSYSWVAKKAGNAHAVRAVGQALKKNPLPLIIPCHRVINKDGKIGGYSPGQDIKKEILDFEGNFL
ncbi:MAG: MGMT family protein [Candidatus Omnitrophota bacterium]